ncbi:G patch domain-containing protein 1 [Perkinsus chesapeaki]|uniref:G patch domain-containing protein 1 n=1 Tax=Perkinsus chesapeaki TaxID=330153 RepID=A0A7J6MMF3_PERCH|nr:G patch domain-containing protein 1 [Perkinsus chesapeaki]
MHKESSTTTSSSSSLSLEVFNGDPDKRRRYEIFCNVNFKELKEFTKLYESINNEDSAGSSSSRHGKDKKVTNEIDDETTSYESNNNLTTPAAQIAEALKILQPSKHVECNWKAEPLVCKRFGCPDPWRHKKFYDDSYEALNKGQRSRWAGGKDRYNRRYKQQQQRDDDKGLL